MFNLMWERHYTKLTFDGHVPAMEAEVGFLTTGLRASGADHYICHNWSPILEREAEIYPNKDMFCLGCEHDSG
jgi:hypothetical protein